MWTVRVKAGQSELHESDGRPYGRRNSDRTAGRHERTCHHVTFSNLYIDIQHVLHCRNKRMCGGDIRVRAAVSECSRLLCVFVYRRIHNERGQHDVHNK